MDALAVVTAYEANAFGIETLIVMPGASPTAPTTSSAVWASPNC
jgi:threonine dehydratase